jgi:hypothetical protein
MLAGSAVGRPGGWRALAVFAVIGMIPDVDFLLPIQHRGPSHGIGSAVLAGALALVVLSLRAGALPRVRLAAAVTLAYASHILLDWLGHDSWEPQGLMALWPLSSAYLVSGLDVFSGISRRYWLPEFWTLNSRAVLREVAILGPLAVVALWARVRTTEKRS